MISKQARRFLIGTALALVATGLVWTRPAAAQGITGTRLVIVAWGDSLREIAQRYDTTVEAIVMANHLASPDHISAGQQLVIPGGAGVQSAQAAPPLDPDGAHVVQPGETLFRISVNYGVSMDALVAANGLVNPSRIYAGQRLIIPGSSAGSATPSLPLQHVVQRGDTLAEIARRYGVSMWALVQANNISNPSILYVGQVLNITNSSTSSGEPSSAPTPAPATGGPVSGVYIVQRGDTLATIAWKYGVTYPYLMQLNGLTNADQIYAGQSLTVPGEGSAPAAPPDPGASSPEGKEVVVVLSTQQAYAYENGELLREFVVSTGIPGFQTVTGTYHIYLKLVSQRMIGPGYDLPGVPWVMYFYKGYGLHGTYWHNNFGTPMSHGCVNMRTEDAAWVFDWAPIGTTVTVRY